MADAAGAAEIAERPCRDWTVTGASVGWSLSGFLPTFGREGIRCYVKGCVVVWGMENNPMNLSVWWLHNLESDSAYLKAGAPEYLSRQLSSRRGRNGRGRLWVDAQFGKNVMLPRLSDWSGPEDMLPGGIVIRPEDARYCVGGRVTSEILAEAA